MRMGKAWHDQEGVESACESRGSRCETGSRGVRAGMKGDDPREPGRHCSFSRHLNLHLDVTGRLVMTAPGALIKK